MSNLDPFQTSWKVPCVLEFNEKSSLTEKGIIGVETELVFEMFIGPGKRTKLRLKPIPPDIGESLLKAMLLSKSALDEWTQEDAPMPFQHVCPKKRPFPCKGKEFGVMLDRSLDGFLVLRLKCIKCGAVIEHDLRIHEPKPCRKCNKTKEDVRLREDPKKPGIYKTYCKECVE